MLVTLTIIQWVSSKICAHSVAKAGVNGSLKGFLECMYTLHINGISATGLGMSGMSTSSGGKKNQL